MGNKTDRWTTNDTLDVIAGIAVLLTIVAIVFTPIVLAIMYGNPAGVRLPWAP
jgi:hypothetical protein